MEVEIQGSNQPKMGFPFGNIQVLLSILITPAILIY